jgi:predicted Zn-dependent protease
MKRKNQKSDDATYRRRFDEAVRLRDEGCLGQAEKSLSELGEDYSGDPTINLVRAGILFSMDKFPEALRLFDTITKLQPRSELASRGLFHSLWKLGRHDEAFEEMKRFLSISESEDYRQLLKDIMSDLR